MREDWSPFEKELAALDVQDRSAHHVRRHHVGSELEPSEIDVHESGQGLRHQGFGRTGHTFQQHVALRKQGHKEQLEDVALTDQYP